MATIKTIAIVGATGRMGSAITKRLSNTEGYRLLLMAHDQERLDDLKLQVEDSRPTAELDTLTCAKDACWEADIIILAIPHDEEKQIAERIHDVATGKVIISISNPTDGSTSKPASRATASAAEQLQRLLPNSKVVKAFNTLSVADFEVPAKPTRTIDIFIAGNNGDAVDVVSKMAASVGFNPVKVGDLSVSRRLENMHKTLLTLHYKG